MSLSYIEVLCADGKTYRDPCWRTSEYFVCYDDNDPVELVIRKTGGLKEKDARTLAEQALNELGFKARIKDNSYFDAAWRYMPENVNQKRITAGSFKKCFRYFIVVLEPPPPPNLYSKVF